MSRAGVLAALAIAVLLGAAAERARGDGAAVSASPARIEARSADFLIVGTVLGDRMTVHVSRIADNAPVTDASLQVILRGIAHPTIAEADGSYLLTTTDLAIPGTAAVQFDVSEQALRETASGTLQIGEVSKESGKDSRQIGWWVLNIVVCFGFLWLWNRRRKPQPED